jgi:hypothetical protein
MIDTHAVAQEVQEHLTAAVHRGQDQMRKSQEQVRKGRDAVMPAIRAGNELAKAVRPVLPTPSVRVPSLPKLASPAKLKASAQELAEQVVATQRSFADKAKQATSPVAEQIVATQRNLTERAKQAAGPVVTTQRNLAGKAMHAASPIVVDGVAKLTQAVVALQGVRKSLRGTTALSAADEVAAADSKVVEPVATEPVAASLPVEEPAPAKPARTRAPKASTAKPSAAKPSAAKSGTATRKTTTGTPKARAAKK